MPGGCWRSDPSGNRRPRGRRRLRAGRFRYGRKRGSTYALALQVVVMMRSAEAAGDWTGDVSVALLAPGRERGQAPRRDVRTIGYGYAGERGRAAAREIDARMAALPGLGWFNMCRSSSTRWTPRADRIGP